MKNKKEKMNLLVENILSSVFDDINKNYIIVSQDHKKMIREQIEEIESMSLVIDNIIDGLTPVRGIVNWGTLGLSLSLLSAVTNLIDAIKNLNAANRVNRTVSLNIIQGCLLASAGFCYLVQASEFTDERRHQWFWTGIICMAFGAVLGVTSFAFSFIQNALFNPSLVTKQAEAIANVTSPSPKLLVWKMAEVVADNTSGQSFLRLVSDFIDGVAVLTYQLTTNRGKTFNILFHSTDTGKIPYIIIDTADKGSFQLKQSTHFLDEAPGASHPLSNGKLAVKIDDIEKIDGVTFNAQKEIAQINKAIEAATEDVEASVADNFRSAKKTMDSNLSQDLGRFISNSEGLGNVDISKITKEVFSEVTYTPDGNAVLSETNKIIFDQIKRSDSTIDEDSFLKAVIAMQNSTGLTNNSERKVLADGLSKASKQADLNLSNLKNEVSGIKERLKAVTYGWLVGADDIAMATKNISAAQLRSAMLTMRSASREICENAATRLEIPLLIKAIGVEGDSSEKLIKSGFIFVADEVDVASGTVMGSIRGDSELVIRIIKQRKDKLDKTLKDSILKQRNNIGDGSTINSKFLNIEYDSDTLIIKISMKDEKALDIATAAAEKKIKNAGINAQTAKKEITMSVEQTKKFVTDANNKINEVNKLNTQTKIDEIGFSMGFSGLEPGSPKKATNWLSNNFYNSPDTKLQKNIQGVLEQAMPTMEQARKNQFADWFGTKMKYVAGKYEMVSSAKGKLLFYISKFASNNFISIDSDGSVSLFGGTSEPIIENYESTRSDSIIISTEMQKSLEAAVEQRLESKLNAGSDGSTSSDNNDLYTY